MTPEQFRQAGREVIDWIADYLENAVRYPVLSQVQPGRIRQGLPPHPPESPEPFDQIMRDFQQCILPGITHWQSPNFFAFFPANNSPPSILGELLSAGLGVQGMLWTTSPACTELETLVLDWMAELLDLPAGFRSNSPGGGVLQDSASSATLCALLAARQRTTGGRVNQAGLDQSDARRMVAYASDQAHSSIDKAVMIAGLGREQLRRIASDSRFAMRPAVLREAIAQDVQAGLTPCLVAATVGSTGAGGVDPLGEIGPICREYNAWLHVDAAMAGSAAICPEHRGIHDGLEFADSYCFNPHKWLLTNFDCDCFYVADRQSLIDALSVTPSYLRNAASDSGQVIDYRDWQIPLGRRFRALKLWFVLRTYGAEGLRDLVRRHVR